jgi:hypothetical protein
MSESSKRQGDLIDWLPWPEWKLEPKIKRTALSKAKRFRILSRDAFTCEYCGRKAPDVELQVDHRVAVARGGTDHDDNLVASCVDCNAGKSATLVLTRSLLRRSLMNDAHRGVLVALQAASDGAFRRHLLGRGEWVGDLCLELPDKYTGDEEQYMDQEWAGGQWPS